VRTSILICLAVLAAGCGSKQQDYSVQGQIEGLKHKDPDIRSTAATVLGKYGAEAKEAVPALTATLKDEDKHVREAAAYALAGIGRDAREALPALKEALKDRDPQVRAAAAHAVKAIQNPGVTQQSKKKKKGA
jgi:HEAT repeat protein